MAKPGNGNDEPTPRGALEKLLVAGVRLSAGFALYGLEQVQRAVEAVRTDGLPGVAGKLETAFDRVSDSLESGVDDTKKEAMRSVSRVTAKAIEKYAEYLSPAAIAEAAGKLAGKGASSSSLNPERGAAPENSPQLAGDVLTGPPET